MGVSWNETRHVFLQFFVIFNEKLEELRKMEKQLTFSVIFLLLFLVYGCQSLSQLEEEQEIHVESKEGFTPHGWKQIAILPFTGNPAFTRVSAEWLAFQLRKQEQIKILNPALVELTLTLNGVQIAEDMEAFVATQELGKLLNAEGLLAGNLTMKYGLSLHARLMLTLVDTRTGEIVLKANMPDEILGGFSEHSHVEAVSERGAKEILKLLLDEPEEPISPPYDDF
ncbi:MAG: hypothetical protein OEY57_06655 [Nitrospirota bacterium]|nr:hypothetical protein [Nitrospirota bacterium]